MKRFVVAITFALFTSLVITKLPASAWESDVHYILTFWLATQTGFARSDADDIAKGNQSFDDSIHHAAISTMCYIAATGDQGAARDLQLKHFPSDAQIPSPPQRRIVSANGPSARAAVEAVLRPTQASTAALALGEALHPFQDSWSHRGVPDIPFGVRPQLSCAHPATRGGWRSHNADRTHLHETDAVDMAMETCAMLRRFLDQNPQFRNQPSADCRSLEPAVREFARARTKTEKDAWAVKYIAEQRMTPVVAALTLPGSSAPSITQVTTVRVRLGMITNQSPPAALIENAQKFLDTWISRNDPAGAAEFVDWNELRRQFTNDPVLGESTSLLMAWCKKFLTMYLVEDHAAVNDAGHGDPKGVGYAELPESPPEQGPYRANLNLRPPSLVPEDLMPAVIERTVVVARGGTKKAGDRTTSRAGAKKPISTVRIQQEDLGFMLAIRMPNQPYDAIGVVWMQRNERWVIVRMFSLIA